jgi:SAM-dependent methyltransferase
LAGEGAKVEKLSALAGLKITTYSIYSALRARGPVKMLQMIAVAVRDKAEDKARGLDAHNFVDSSEQTKGHPNSPYANYYQPIRSAPFREMLKKLNPDTSYNFVDIGAGTGKAMILAAEHGFKNVRGAELVKELCDVAEVNFSRFRNDFPGAQLAIYHADALAFEFDERDAFFLLNDPFSDEVFRPFLERVKRFAEHHPQEIVLVYKNNNLRKMPSLDEFKKHCSHYLEHDLSGNFFQVYYLNGPAGAQTSIS